MIRLGLLLLAMSAGCGRYGFDALDGDGHDGATSPVDSAVGDGGQPIDGAAPTMGIVDLNGGASWNGWERIDQACNDTHWVTGDATRSYAFYRSRFLLDGAQTVSATRLADGAPGDGSGIVGASERLFEDGWQVGDRIVGIGLELSGASQMTRLFFHVDYDGDSIMPASSCGADDGVTTWNAGDTSSYFTGDSGLDWEEFQYSVFTGFSSDGGDNFTVAYGNPPPAALGPSRSFVILAPGSTVHGQSGQFLLNLDQVLRLGGGAGSGEGTCNSNTRLGFLEADSASAGAFSQQIIPFGGCF